MSGLGAGIAAVMLPPLGVWLVAGIGRNFWIAVALTCLFFVPGMIWALFVLFRSGLRGRLRRTAKMAGSAPPVNGA